MDQGNGRTGITAGEAMTERREDIALELARKILRDLGYQASGERAKEIADHVAALLRPHVWEWIPVEERLPEITLPARYLSGFPIDHWKGSSVDVVTWSSWFGGIYPGMGSYPEIGYLAECDEGQQWINSRSQFASHVTHWTPIHPPKGNDKKAETKAVEGTYACPICGCATPHAHSDEQIAEWRLSLESSDKK